MFGSKNKSESLGETIAYLNGGLTDLCHMHFLFLYTDHMNEFIDAISNHLLIIKDKIEEINNEKKKINPDNLKELKQYVNSMIEAFLTFRGLPEKHNVTDMLKYVHTHHKAMRKKIPDVSVPIQNFVQIYEFYESLNLIHALYTKGEAHASTTK